MKIKRTFYSTFLCMLLNLGLAYIAWEVSRLAYLAENWNTFAQSLTWHSFGEISHGGLVFDTSAIMYCNLLFITLMLMPLHFKESDRWQRAARWVFAVCNSIAIALNLMDAVYFPFTGRRTTATIFSEFGAETNLFAIFGVELVRHWYLVVLWAVLTWLLWRCFFTLKGDPCPQLRRPRWWGRVTVYYAAQLVFMFTFTPLMIFGIRGGTSAAIRPITISNANKYVDRPLEAALVLNTPFSLIRSAGRKAFVVPDYMPLAQMRATYSPLHRPGDTPAPRRGGEAQSPKKNVVVLIVESFGREYIGGYNGWMEGHQSYTPFVDSLLRHSLTWEYTYCNGRKSVDGMPSVLSGIPMFVEPFFFMPEAMNDVSGIAGQLRGNGYHSAFFHGAVETSMGFQAFARTTGFTESFGREDYEADRRFGGSADFDGKWAIFDEPFLQFTAAKLNTLPQPFMGAVFTASSHHPYVIPEKYKEVYPEERLPIHKCIRYTDNALRKFFDTVKRQPWYENTLFVLTSDHTNQSQYPYYRTSMGIFCSPIILFDPSGDLPAEVRPGIAQQIDIMPTVLGYLGCEKPFVAFGCDLLTTPAEQTWAVNYLNGTYQYAKGDWLMQFDGVRVKAMYRFRTDLLLQENLVDTEPQVQAQMELELKAIIQDYMIRMTGNGLVVREE